MPKNRSPLARASTLSIIMVCGSALAGCSVQRMALDQTAAILKRAQAAFEREWDYELAAQSLPTNIKLVEGFLESGPDNTDLLELAAKAYTSYALLILEDQLEQLEEDSPEADRVRNRASEMYLRGHRFGLRLLDERHPGFSAAFAKGGEALDAALKGCDAEDALGLVWSAMPLGSAINLRRDDVALIALVPKAKALAQRAVELDERYYNGAAHLMLGGIYGAVAPMFGGDPPRARKHFEAALRITRRRFLLIQVMYAKTLAVQLQDERLFRSLLREVLDAKLEIYPEQQLANTVAKRKARRLLARADELF